MAKDLVRTRRYEKKFMLMKANIQAVSLKIHTLRSQNAMAQAMKGVTRAMQNMNRYGLHLSVVLLIEAFLMSYSYLDHKVFQAATFVVT